MADVPNLVQPSVDKIDLEHLLRDLPKYKPWLSAQAWEHWEEFIRHTDDLSKTQHCSNAWELPRLISAAITRPTCSDSVSISSDTLALLAKETDVPAKVCVYMYVSMYVSRFCMIETVLYTCYNGCTTRNYKMPFIGLPRFQQEGVVEENLQ